MAQLEEEDRDEGPGRRCSVGCESWPDDDQYNPCPRCGLPTKRYSNLVPLSTDEAFTIANRIDFEDWYENEWPQEREAWCVKHGSELLTEDQLEALAEAS